ncbi:MAG: glycosyltransferase family 2 protein [Candidatus Omnitrophica bacterium]|nr:glycosyltransferase family 2 protein [Candidatus Omnitrophota bacterium]
MNIQKTILRTLYKIHPFSLKGDLGDLTSPRENFLSCLILTQGRSAQLENLLYDLSCQNLNKSQFEVVIVENNKRNVETELLCQKYSAKLNIIYKEDSSTIFKLGTSRNLSVQLSKGDFLLFLDDDARILQNDFLSKAVKTFQNNKLDILIPAGKPLYGIMKRKYCFLDKFSFATRCIFYKRTFLKEIGGFQNELFCYDDIELGVRSILQNANIKEDDSLEYYHPPLYFETMQKPYCIGQSILSLRKRYSFILWLAIYLNALRYLVYILFPDTVRLQWFKISLGVLSAPFLKKKYTY